MKPYLTLLFLFPILLLAQRPNRFGRTNSDALPEKFRLSDSEIRAHIYDGIPEKIKQELSPRVAYYFADRSAVQLSSTFSSGTVYSDWPAFEDYLNKVMQKIIPEELAKDTIIHAYLVKDGMYNAFMTPAGLFFVNAGLFDETLTEAGLAGVMAHELAHYYMRHSLNRFVKAEKGDFNRVFKKSSTSKFSIQNELQSDSLAIVWMNRSGYGIRGMKEATQAMDRLKNRLLLTLEDEWDLKEITHPAPERRIAQVDSFATANKWTEGADFLVSKEKFYAFKEFVKPEILRYLLNNFYYDHCIELAFKYHVMSPNRPEIVYYLMEAIRRKCYFNVDHWKERFIIDRYFKIIETANGTKKKVKYEDHLFKNYIEEIIGIKKEDLGNFEGSFYWNGDVKFETYKEAFDFFAQIGELLNEPECALSHALAFTQNPTRRNELLEKYLAYETIQYRDFASKLLRDEIHAGLPQKTLTVLMDFLPMVDQSDQQIFIRGDKRVDDDQLNAIIKGAVEGFANREALNHKTLMDNRLNDYIILAELKQLCIKKIISKGERTELHILDPRYWQIMHKLGVNEFEFVDFIFYDSRGSERSLEAYQKVVNTSLPDFLNEVKRTRYLEGRMLSIRMMPKSFMKVETYGEEVKGDYNKSAVGSIVNYMHDMMEKKDKYAKQFDGKQE
ncbi:MAG: M48 family metallopeptidase [Saprospiraceae bacterium]|nr:M48 family metallopeptidase [Saprospiraceae bacterium]